MYQIPVRDARCQPAALTGRGRSENLCLKKLKRYGDEALTWQTLRSWAGSFRAAFALSAKRERIVEKRCVPSIERCLSKLLMRHHFVSSARCNSPCSRGGTIAVDAGTRSATNTQLGV